MNTSYHFATVRIHHNRKGEEAYISPDEPDFELESGYWCRKDGSKIDPFDAFDLKAFEKAEPNHGAAVPPTKVLEDIYQISITGAGNSTDPIYRSAIDWDIEGIGEEYFIEPFAAALIILAEKFLRHSSEPKDNHKGGRHAQMLTLWENYSGFDYWGEYDEQFHLIGLLEPHSTGTKLITTTDFRASKASTILH